MRWASCSPSSIRGRRGTGRRTRAPSRPPSTNERRTRWTVIAPRSRASLICSSDHAGPRSLQSAFSRMRARVNLRAAALPLATNESNWPRSSTDKRTTNLLVHDRTPSQDPGETARIGQKSEELINTRLTRHLARTLETANHVIVRRPRSLPAVYPGTGYHGNGSWANIWEIPPLTFANRRISFMRQDIPFPRRPSDGFPNPGSYG